MKLHMYMYVHKRTASNVIVLPRSQVLEWYPLGAMQGQTSRHVWHVFLKPAASRGLITVASYHRCIHVVLAPDVQPGSHQVHGTVNSMAIWTFSQNFATPAKLAARSLFTTSTVYSTHEYKYPCAIGT